MTDQRIETTQSMWASFKNCRKKMEFRYLRHLRVLTDSRPLVVGSVAHDALESHHSGQDPQRVLQEGLEQERIDRAEYMLISAMMRGYAARYPVEDFKVDSLEHEFEVPISNPATGAKSKTFVLRGKVDGIIEKDGGLWLIEHKTKSGGVDGAYIERLWTDFQIAVYAGAIETYLGRPVEGVLYNVLCKSKLKQREGETEEDFRERYALACSLNKSGKSSAVRKFPESDRDFAARLDKWYQLPEAFHREALVLSPQRIAEVRDELWELTQAYLEARRRGVWYQNTSQCFSYNRPCEYFPLCRSGGNALVEQTHYRIEDPNEELTPKPQEPAF